MGVSWWWFLLSSYSRGGDGYRTDVSEFKKQNQESKTGYRLQLKEVWYISEAEMELES